MEPMYNSNECHSPLLETGGSVANFDREQAIFLYDIDCDDSLTFAAAVKNAVPNNSSKLSLDHVVRCSKNCMLTEDECNKTLDDLLSGAKVASNAVAQRHR